MDLQEFFESIELSTIDDFVQDGRVEDLNLEFKTVNKNSLDRDDRKNFAKALSGFANSSGGIVVWGVYAYDNGTGIDAACEKKPIVGLSKLLSRLNSFTGEFVSPVVDGVLHRILEIEDDSGFAITLVPESSSGPHMAKAGEDRYYKRSGDSFRRMEHFDVADMFGRRPQPKIEFEIEVDIVGNDLINKARTAHLVLCIKNSGKGIARYPYLSMKIKPPYIIWRGGLDGNLNTGLPRLAESRMRNIWATYGGSSEIVVYPNMLLRVVSIKKTFLEDTIPEDLHIEYVLACDGVDLISGIETISGPDLHHKVFSAELDNAD